MPQDPRVDPFSSLCSDAYSIRLCTEMWRPFLHTSYVDSDQSHSDGSSLVAAPYAINVTRTAAAVQQHAERLRLLWRAV